MPCRLHHSISIGRLSSAMSFHNITHMLTPSRATGYLAQGAAHVAKLCPAHSHAHVPSVLRQAIHEAHTDPTGCVEPSSSLSGDEDCDACWNLDWLFSAPSSVHSVSCIDEHISLGKAIRFMFSVSCNAACASKVTTHSSSQCTLPRPV